ncbi:MAG TPA: hypothetical protein PLE74_08845 [Candidatus Cloacimonadota bacterium]|nr:hypothetical protein [Candidatus Cloacimonadota bacterium]
MGLVSDWKGIGMSQETLRLFPVYHKEMTCAGLKSEKPVGGIVQ